MSINRITYFHEFINHDICIFNNTDSRIFNLSDSLDVKNFFCFVFLDLEEDKIYCSYF